jgi:hypothetical protein
LPKKAVMTNVSRPLLGLLVATVLFFGLWIVALKPSSSSTSPNGPGLGQYQSAINRAKASAASQDRAAAAANATSATGSSSPSVSSGAHAAAKSATAATKSAAAKSATATAHAGSRTRASTSSKTSSKASSRTHTAKAATPRLATTAERVNAVQRALADHKVLALLVYNPAAADDRAVKQELGTIPTRGGRVVKVAVPVSEIAAYPVVTNQVLISSSPTLVIIDSSRQAFTIVGYAAQFEIAHRIDDALSMR